jgi:hypothetical protein
MPTDPLVAAGTGFICADFAGQLLAIKGLIETDPILHGHYALEDWNMADATLVTLSGAPARDGTTV